MRAIALLIFISLPLSVSAGAAFDLFGDGLFGVTWGDTMAQIKALKPGGEQKDVGGMIFYSTNDPRTVLGIDRVDTPTIAYAIDPRRGLYNVSVDFPGDMDLMGQVVGQLHNLLGPPSVEETGSAAAMAIRWPVDNTIEVIVSTSFGGLFGKSSGSLSVTKHADQVTPQDKDALGFN